VRLMQALCAAEITGGACYALPRLRESRDVFAAEADEVRERVRLVRQRIALVTKEIEDGQTYQAALRRQVHEIPEYKGAPGNSDRGSNCLTKSAPIYVRQRNYF